MQRQKLGHCCSPQSPGCMQHTVFVPEKTQHARARRKTMVCTLLGIVFGRLDACCVPRGGRCAKGIHPGRKEGAYFYDSYLFLHAQKGPESDGCVQEKAATAWAQGQDRWRSKPASCSCPAPILPYASLPPPYPGNRRCFASSPYIVALITSTEERRRRSEA